MEKQHALNRPTPDQTPTELEAKAHKARRELYAYSLLSCQLKKTQDAQKKSLKILFYYTTTPTEREKRLNILLNEKRKQEKRQENAELIPISYMAEYLAEEDIPDKKEIEKWALSQPNPLIQEWLNTRRRLLQYARVSTHTPRKSSCLAN